MITVLHISSAKNWRGGENQLKNLMQGIDKLDAKVSQHLICINKSKLHSFCIENKISHSLLKNRIFFIFFNLFEIFRVCKKFQINIIHIHDSKSLTYIVLSQLLFFYRIPIVLSRKVYFPIKNNFLTSFKYNFSSVKKIICISNEIQKVVEKRFNKANTIVIYDAIDTEISLKENFFRDNFNIEKNIILIGYVASMTDEKDHFTFLKAAETINNINKNCMFLLIGDGVNKSNLINFSKDLGLSDKVIFTGFIKNVNYYLSDIDICLFTSKNEGLGSSILDFFLAKVPVVTTNAGGIKNIVEDNYNGLLCPIKDDQCLSLKVLQIIENFNKRKVLTENAFQYVNQFHSIKTFSQKHVNVYNEILNKNRKL
ncbi:glycosyltransferase family 4 protein [Polaribacter sp.]|uniref:glycosyltransferase family 4 protein n=1 Tax=Polaribacter sp. TaxID=1920175 RepID=UPI0040487BE1